MGSSWHKPIKALRFWPLYEEASSHDCSRRVGGGVDKEGFGEESMKNCRDILPLLKAFSLIPENGVGVEREMFLPLLNGLVREDIYNRLKR